MLASEARVGMQVFFGRAHGEKTLGEITKLNEKTAKVKTLEERGVMKSHPVGQVWTVPYTLMSPVTSTRSAVQSAPVQPSLKYNMFSDENDLLEAILTTYSMLSPENLTGDGELPRHVVQRKLAAGQRRLKGLEIALGRRVTEVEIYEWHRSKIESESKQPQFTS